MLYSVHLVELQGTGELYAMKAMDKSVMFNRNKVLSCLPFSSKHIFIAMKQLLTVGTMAHSTLENMYNAII